MALVYCAFCGQGRRVESKPNTEEHRREAVEHMRTCQQHPMHAIAAENNRLRETLARIRTVIFIDDNWSTVTRVGTTRDHLKAVIDAALVREPNPT